METSTKPTKSPVREDVQNATFRKFEVGLGVCLALFRYLSRVGPSDDDVRVEGVEPRREHGALRRQLVLWPVLHRHRPAPKHNKANHPTAGSQWSTSSWDPRLSNPHRARVETHSRTQQTSLQQRHIGMGSMKRCSKHSSPPPSRLPHKDKAVRICVQG